MAFVDDDDVLTAVAPPFPFTRSPVVPVHDHYRRERSENNNKTHDQARLSFSLALAALPFFLRVVRSVFIPSGKARVNRFRVRRPKWTTANVDDARLGSYFVPVVWDAKQNSPGLSSSSLSDGRENFVFYPPPLVSFVYGCP